MDDGLTGRFAALATPSAETPRREWASERTRHPLPDVAAAGGCQDR
jgi:hypothetical protein